MTKTRHLRFLLAAFDSMCVLAVATAALFWAQQRRLPSLDLSGLFSIRVTVLEACLSIVFAFSWMKCCDSLGLYSRDATSTPRLLMRTLAGTSLMTGMLALLLKIDHRSMLVRSAVVNFFLAALVLEAVRVSLSSYTLPLQFGEPDKVIILGTGRRASKAWRELRTRHHGMKDVLGFFDDRDVSTLAPDIARRYIGRVDELSEFLLLNVVDEIIVATPMRSCYDLTQRAISIAQASGLRVLCLNDAFNASAGVHLRRPAKLFYRLIPRDERQERAELLKRGLDAFLAAFGLVLLFPLFLLIAACIKLTSPGPVLFVQERYGHGRRLFRMYKFRSMVRHAPGLLASLESLNEASGPIFKIKNDPRVTPLGRILRSTSLDELPQLWNVLLGDMSLVGPRPMSVRDVSLFDEAQLMRRFSVRPGITGSWQIAGRSSLTFDQWIALDFSYIDEWTFGLDLKILARTVPAVLRRHGAA